VLTVEELDLPVNDNHGMAKKPIRKHAEKVYRDLGARIKQLRNEKGWSQEDLAEKLKVDRTFITYIESGRTRIQMIDVERVAKIFELSIEELLHGIWL